MGRDAAAGNEHGREDFAIERVTKALGKDYAGDLPPDEVRAAVEAARENYADAPVREFVPILVERDARETLDDELGATDGRSADGGSDDDE